MSDVMPRDFLSELWQEILQRQWRYIETEESIKKLEERKKLEASLKDLLCRVRQDRKFFLPETGLVLKNTVCQQQDFSVNRAIGAFEAISQYANNLYSKPWRKEFRILKMYSGFYQHEIKSSLIDAEKLFITMGYRSLSDDTMILDGPICPDQVLNVSRDAMTAYVELQIMKNIRLGLEAKDITVSWLDIFWYREKHVGGTTQAIKDLIYAAEEKIYRNNEKVLATDNYGYIDVQPSASFATPSSMCQCNNSYHPPMQMRQRINTNGPCCAHEFSSHQFNHNRGNLMFGQYPSQQNYHQHQQTNMMGSHSLVGGGHLPHMSHSRSLEHYSDGQSQSMLPHRHSFDHQQQGCTAAVHHQHHMAPHRMHPSMQQQYYHHNAPKNYHDPTYECLDENSVDGGSSISYAAVSAAMPSAGTDRGGVVGKGGGGYSSSSAMNYNINATTYANPYNVSCNRLSLPYNISNQFSAYDNNSGHHLPGDSYYGRDIDNHMYAQVTKLPQNHMITQVNGSTVSSNDATTIRPNQQYMSDQLIDFGDPPILPPPPASQFDPYHQQQQQQQYSSHESGRGKRYGKESEVEFSNYATPREHSGKINNGSDMYVYAKPIPKECRQLQRNTSSSLDKSAYLRKTSFNSANERGAGDTTDLSYESANDDLNTLSRQNQPSPTQFSKNQDGVGSFESWNYVFKNLERSGYSKDLGEREDLLVKSLGLDSLNITNDSTAPSQTSSADKRRTPYKENDNSSSQVKQRTRIFESTDKVNVSSNHSSSKKPQMDNNKQKIKSALKQNSPGISKQMVNKTVMKTGQQTKKNTKINDNKSRGQNYNNDNNNTQSFENSKANKKSSSTQSTMKKQSLNAEAPTSSAATTSASSSTKIIVTAANEWSCSFCTFINTDNPRICEICYHTKDFNLDAASTATNGAANSTTAGAVAHNAPTCV